MAAISPTSQGVRSLLRFNTRLLDSFGNASRTLVTGSRLLRADESDDIPVKKGWFEKLLQVRTIAPSKESHATKLASKETLYEIIAVDSSHAVSHPYTYTFLPSAVKNRTCLCSDRACSLSDRMCLLSDSKHVQIEHVHFEIEHVHFQRKHVCFRMELDCF
ncbi:hypothetical protein MAR_008638 [Mya arenaria]|uniref:Uncharacterized protein n=1 Tax=Mya arenaria TaxID=6604 RepID=A0ABY7DZI4_MYAAR|nr:hypothetical protein MAR_008638 [Mya arenaria]